MRPNTKIEIDFETADDRDTQRLFKAIEKGEDVRLAKTANRTFLVALATLVNHAADATEIRILVGAWTEEEDAENEENVDGWDDDPDDLDDLDEDEDQDDDDELCLALLGLRDPGRVAHQIAEQLKAARRSGTATIRTHLGIETAGGELVDLVEVEAYLD